MNGITYLKKTVYDLTVDRAVGKIGMMLVGWKGNNGSTVTAGIIGNRRGLSWDTREGKQAADYYGSAVMASTMRLGIDAATGKKVNLPVDNTLLIFHLNDLVINGWEISSISLDIAID